MLSLSRKSVQACICVCAHAAAGDDGPWWLYWCACVAWYIVILWVVLLVGLYVDGKLLSSILYFVVIRIHNVASSLVGWRVLPDSQTRSINAINGRYMILHCCRACFHYTINNTFRRNSQKKPWWKTSSTLDISFYDGVYFVCSARTIIPISVDVITCFDNVVHMLSASTASFVEFTMHTWCANWKQPKTSIAKMCGYYGVMIVIDTNITASTIAAWSLMMDSIKSAI